MEAWIKKIFFEVTPESLLSFSLFFSTLLQHILSFFPLLLYAVLILFHFYCCDQPNFFFFCLLNSPSKLGSTKFSIIHYTSRSITLRWFSQRSSSPEHQLWPDQGWFGITQTRCTVHNWKQRLQIKTEERWWTTFSNIIRIRLPALESNDAHEQLESIQISIQVLEQSKAKGLL